MLSFRSAALSLSSVLLLQTAWADPAQPIDPERLNRLLKYQGLNPGWRHRDRDVGPLVVREGLNMRLNRDSTRASAVLLPLCAHRAPRRRTCPSERMRTRL